MRPEWLYERTMPWFTQAPPSIWRSYPETVPETEFQARLIWPVPQDWGVAVRPVTWGGTQMFGALTLT